MPNTFDLKTNTFYDLFQDCDWTGISLLFRLTVWPDALWFKAYKITGTPFSSFKNRQLGVICQVDKLSMFSYKHPEHVTYTASNILWLIQWSLPEMPARLLQRAVLMNSSSSSCTDTTAVGLGPEVIHFQWRVVRELRRVPIMIQTSHWNTELWHFHRPPYLTALFRS